LGAARRVSAWGGLVPALVSTPCRIKPCMRFSLTRLSDNLLPGACAIPDRTLAKPPATDFGREYTVVDPLASGIAFAGVVVMCGAGGIGPLGACTVTYLPALAWLKQGSFPPPGGVPMINGTYDPLRLLTRHPPELRIHLLIPRVT
jgi:hypothetical protein